MADLTMTCCMDRPAPGRVRLFGPQIPNDHTQVACAVLTTQPDAI